MLSRRTFSSTVRSMYRAAESVAWGWRRRGSRETPVPPRQKELDQLLALGIHPEGLSGRLRLVLTIGCYHDFRFTRDILSTGAAQEQADLAIKALVELGAHCDCQVLQALGQLPRGVLWHHPTAPGAG